MSRAGWCWRRILGTICSRSSLLSLSPLREGVGGRGTTRPLPPIPRPSRGGGVPGSARRRHRRAGGDAARRRPRPACRSGTPPPWRRAALARCSTGGGPPRSAPRHPTPPAPTSPPRSTAMLAPVAAGPPCFVHRDYLRRQPDLAAGAQRPPPRRRDRLPGRRDRPSRLRPGLAAAGRPPRHPAPRSPSVHSHATSPPARSSTRPPSAPPSPPAPPSGICASPCQWVRLAQRDSRPHYLAYGPRTWRLLDDALRHPGRGAARRRAWIAGSRPRMRANPPGLAA